MWAAAIERNGGPEVLQHMELADPDCPDDGLVIDVEAISVERADLIARVMTPLPRSPHVIGSVAAGTVVEVGAAVTDRRIGERVVTVGATGSHASRRAVAASLAWPIPEGLASREAACVPIAFGTAFECLFTAGDLQPGQTVLVHAGAGGIGMAAIQLAKLAGATVVATASTADRLERLAALGLDHGIASDHADLAAEVARRVGPHGVDLVVDSVGGRTLDDSVALLAWRGRLVSVGAAVGRGATLDASRLGLRGNSVHGVQLSATIRAEPARSFAMIAECIGGVAAGRLEVRVARTFPLADAAAAHAFIEGRHAVGRVVIE